MMQLQSNRFFYKFHDFIALNLLNEHTWLGGGALRSALADDEEVVDYDLFFNNSLGAAKVEVELESLGAETIFKCPEGKLTTMVYNGMKIQLITEFFYVNMEECINSFDINACRFITDGINVYTKYSAVRDVLKKQITLNRVDFPTATMLRVAKYAKKGYKLKSTTAKNFVEEIWQRGKDNLDIDMRVYID
jgi:hypothetical protein